MRSFRTSALLCVALLGAAVTACSSSATSGTSASTSAGQAATTAPTVSAQATDAGTTPASPSTAVTTTASTAVSAPQTAPAGVSTGARASTVAVSPSPAEATAAGTTAATTGCEQLTDGTHTLQIGGVNRQFDLYVPAALSFMRRPLPLMVLFHGFAGTAAAIAADTRLATQAPNAGVILAVPQGVDSPASWHVDGSFGDNDFIDALLRQLTSSSCVDPSNVWLTGFSAGSAFTGVYGCAHAAQFAGLVMVSGLPPAICPDKDSPIIQISHGIDDPLVPFKGGDQVVGSSSVHLDPVPTSAAAWAAKAGCAPTPVTAEIGTASEVTTWSGCTRGPTVSLVAVSGLGHAWPSAVAPAGQAAKVPVVDPGCVALKTMTNLPGDLDTACLS